MRQRISLPFVATVAVLLLLPAAAGPGDDDALRPLVDGDRTKEYITFLASDELGGRQSCTDGYRRAADWAAARFEEWGLAPAGDDGTWFQQVPIRDFDVYDGVPRLDVAARTFLLDDEDFSVQSVSTTGTKVTAEVVFVGYGISAPDQGLDEYADMDVTGKVVLALKGSPHAAPAARQTFSRSPTGPAEAEGPDPWKDMATDAAKAEAAYAKGAAALLLHDPDAAADDGARRFRSRSRGGGFTPEKSFLCFDVGERVFRAILKQDPQETPRGLGRRVDSLRRQIKDGTPGSYATGVRATLKGYDAHTRYSKENENNTARNVLARIEGTDPALKNQYVVFGAHLDHVGSRDGYVRNGADDNASGSAVALEVARVLAGSGFQPKRTIIVGLWCGEELGLIGSNYWVEHPTAGATIDQVSTYFNMDMVGLGDAIGAPGALNFPSIWEVIQRDQDPQVLEAVQPSTGGPGGSDHSPFISRGIEAMALMTRGGGGHPDYHQPEDDADKMEPEILRKTGQFVLQGVMNLANETEVELLIPDRLRLYQALRMQLTNFNPDLEGSRWSRVAIEAPGRDALQASILDQALEIIHDRQTQQASSRRGSFGGRQASAPPASQDSKLPPQRSVTRGVADLKAFGGDVDLLLLASEFHGFGRVDFRGDDGFWVKDGRLTDGGRQALRTLEEKELFVHLESPGTELIGDFVGATSKPFLITGVDQLEDSTAERLGDRGVLLGVALDPKQLDDFVTRLEALKERIGKRELLVAWPVKSEGLDEAKQELYLKLHGRGWAHREICGSRRGGGGVTGGNLQAVVGGSSGRGRGR